MADRARPRHASEPASEPVSDDGRSWPHRRGATIVATGASVLVVAMVIALACGFRGGRGSAAEPISVLDSATSSPFDPPPPARVEVIGDSLTRQSKDHLARTLADRGYRSVITSKPRESLDRDFVQAALAASEERPSEVVVLATAANDALTEAGQSAWLGPDDARVAYRARLTDAITRFPGRCVVVVNARDVSPIFAPEQAGLLNGDIEAVAALHDDVIVVDWASISRTHTDDWFIADLEHFGLDPDTTTDVLPGAQGYADAITDGVTRCPVHSG